MRRVDNRHEITLHLIANRLIPLKCEILAKDIYQFAVLFDEKLCERETAERTFL